jgi:hypothetical protein
VAVAALIVLTGACQQPPGPGAPTTTVVPASGVRGTVVLGPVCPVEGIAGCENQPREADVRLSDRASGSAVATVRSGSDGRFQVALAPGDYVMEADLPQAMFCKPVYVTVDPATYTDVTVKCDTGLRPPDPS